MSLLRTTQTSRTGTQRLSSYSQSRRENNAHPWDRRHTGVPASPRRRPTSTGMPSSIDWVAGGTMSVSTPAASQYSTDDELNSILRAAAYTILGTIGESREPTEESVPPMSKGSSSGSSSFSVTRAFGAKQTRSESPTQRKESPSHPPRFGKHSIQQNQHERSRSPVKTVHIRKPAYNQRMVVPSISVGKIELQNSPVTSTSPRPSNTPSAKSRDRYKRATANMAGAIDNVSFQDQLDLENEKDRERATRLLSKVDKQKQASLKVQQARGAAKAAIEKTRRARAEKERKTEKERKVAPPVTSEIFDPNNLSNPGKPSAFNYNLFELLERKVAPPVASEMFDPNNPSSPGQLSPFNDNLFGLLDDESVNLEGDRYALMDHYNPNKISRGDRTDDVMDTATGLFAPLKNLNEHYARADLVKNVPVSEAQVSEAQVSEAQVNADDFMFVTGMCDLFREELLLLSGEGDQKEATDQAKQAKATTKVGEATIPSIVIFEINLPAQNHRKAESLNTTEAESAGNESKSDFADAVTWESSEHSYLKVKKDPPASGQDPPEFGQDLPSSSGTDDEMSDAFPVEAFDEADESEDISNREEKYRSRPAHLEYPFGDLDVDWTCKSDELDDKPKQETEKATRLVREMSPLGVLEDDSTDKTENELKGIKNFTADSLDREPREKASRLEKMAPPLDVQEDDSTNRTEDELDGIMNFTAVMLGRKTKEKATRLDKIGPPIDVQDGYSTNKTENELDDIMNFAAGLLDRGPKEKATGTRLKKSVPPVGVEEDDSKNKTDTEHDDIMNFAAGLLDHEPARKRKTPASAPTGPKPIWAVHAASDANGYQSAQAIRQREFTILSKPKTDGSCYQGCPNACSARSDDIFCPPEEEVVFVPTDNPVNVAKAMDIPQGTELGDKPPSLLAASMKATVNDNVIANPLLMLHTQTAEIDGEVPDRKSNENLVLPPSEAFSSRRLVPPPPEAFTFSPRSGPILSPAPSKVFISNEIPTSPRSKTSLADDLTEKSSPSVNFPDLFAQREVSKVQNPDIQRVVHERALDIPKQPQYNVQHAEQYGLQGQTSLIIQRSTQRDAAHLFLKSTHDGSIEPVEANEKRPISFESSSRGSREPRTVSEKVNKSAMTVLDSDDEFWDTLSTIASTKNLSMNRVLHPHPHNEPDTKNHVLAKSTKGGALGALVCNFWPTANLMRAKNVEDEDRTLDSSDESLAPEIPRYVSFANIQREMEQKQKCEKTLSRTTDAARALGNIDTLITKESDCSPESLTSFDMPNKINSFHAEELAHNLDDAIMKGKEMAATVGASRDDTSGVMEATTIGASSTDTKGVVSPRCGSDEGDEPLGSPSLLSHDSRVSQANPKSRRFRITDNKHPWSKRGSIMISKAKSTTQLKEEDSELAAMLGIGITSAQSTVEGDAEVGTLITGENSDEADLFMVLTRSNGEDDSDEYNLAQKQVQLQPVTDEGISSQLSGDVEVMVLPQSLTQSGGDKKFATTEVDFRVRPRAKELISSPLSGDGEAMALTRSNDDEKFDTAHLGCEPHPRVERVLFPSLSGEIKRIPSPSESDFVLASSNNRNTIVSLEEEVPDGHLLEIIGYLSATQSHEDESEIIPDEVVQAPPDKALEIPSPIIKDTHMLPDGEMTECGEETYIPPFLNDLLSKYDTIIQMLLNEKEASAGKSENSKDVEIALKALREQRERSLGTSESKTPSPLHQMQESQPQEGAAQTQSPVRRDEHDSVSSPILPLHTPPPLRQKQESRPEEGASQTQSPIRRHERDSASPPISSVHTQSPGHDFPTRSRVQSNQKLRESPSSPRSPRTEKYTLHSLEMDSPARPTDRTPLRSNLRELSVSVGREQEPQSRDSKSRTHSPRRSTLASRSCDSDSIARPSLGDEELQSHLSWSPTRLSRRQKLTSRREQLEKRRATLSPSRSPSHRASCLRVTSPTWSAGRQRRVSPTRSPLRQRSTRRTRPRPEDMATRKKISRSRSQTPGPSVRDLFCDHDLVLAGSRASERRSRAEMREPEIVLDVMRRIHTPDRQRDRFFVEGDDYAEKSRMVREQLDVARCASRSINASHEYLFDELQEFKRKLSHHSMRKDVERRALVSESHRALEDFHNLLEHFRHVRANGRDTPDTVEAVESALEEAWEDFDNFRKVLLTNLKILNDAKEELMRKKLYEEEESDEEQLRSLERMMCEIRDREHHKTEDALNLFVIGNMFTAPDWVTITKQSKERDYQERCLIERELL